MNLIHFNTFIFPIFLKLEKLLNNLSLSIAISPILVEESVLTLQEHIAFPFVLL